MKLFLPLLLVLIFAAPSVRGATLLDLPEFRADDPDVGGGLKAAYAAHQDGRFIEAFAAIQRAVQTDDPRAWFFLGWLYETGRGTTRDVSAAERAYKKAASLGNESASFRRCNILLRGDEAQRKEAGAELLRLAEKLPGPAGLMLGEAYANGFLGEEPSFEEAQKWWQQSAKSGESRALLNLSKLLEGRYGFPERVAPEAALEALRQAAELGNALAMAALGSRYLNGGDEVRNETLGLKWLGEAAALKVADADLVLGDHEAEEKKDFLKARKHYEAAIENGNVTALVRLGRLEQGGVGGKANPENALDLYKRAAARGSADGAHSAASLLLNAEGDGAGALVADGYRFLLAAAAQSAAAQVDLALLYLSGRLGVADPVSAAAWFDRAARLGNPQAQNNLAALFESGTGVTRNLKSAANLYVLAARQGHPSATTALGRFYAQGTGVEQDLMKAWAYFSVAAERGDDDGARLLGQLTAQMSDPQLEQARTTLRELKNPTNAEKESVPVAERGEGSTPAPDEGAAPASEPDPKVGE